MRKNRAESIENCTVAFSSAIPVAARNLCFAGIGKIVVRAYSDTGRGRIAIALRQPDIP